MADIQTEHACQKQPTIFKIRTGSCLGKLARRSSCHRGQLIDKKCPFTGNVSIRGQVLSSNQNEDEEDHSLILPDYLHYIGKHNRFEKGHRNMSVHLSPCFRGVQIRDTFTEGNCWPPSKTAPFHMHKITKAAGTKKQVQKF
ncbi:hypothetical protein FD755_023059 [Muntiacus reevesi]|uniref:Small ribosomal subunit protein uS17 n=1 Tax=Muntiacus reevesi TaxID=9886 RepID=A0A5N3VZ77_MUNRE|nr:hypothetical protein FD755_023059 [Muntiacus reevesi]